MDETIELLRTLIAQAAELADQFSEEEMQEILSIFGKAAQAIQGRQAGSTAAAIPPGANLLWILSGGQPDAFVNYLRTFPNPALNALIRNPTQLTQTIERLEREMPRGEPAVSDGIHHSSLQSSNIWGFSYNPKTQKLLVKFNSGSVYGYTGVQPFIFKIFQSGAIPAKTNGQNRFGKWWRGKTPSLGASMHQLIKLGGYPYQRLS